MKIAVTSQNRKTVTEHPGRCRKFWIYAVDQGGIIDKRLVEISRSECLHESAPEVAQALKDIEILITASAGSGLEQRLKLKGIQLLVTDEQDPDRAVGQLLKERIR